MKRKLTDKIREWYQSGTSVPLLVIGPRGTGKTYSALEFALELKQRYIYVNFETDYEARRYYEDNFIPENIENDGIVFIFDEIQASDILLERLNAVNSLLNCKIVCLSSFLKKSVLGAFKRINVGPLEFDEYLRAIGKEWYLEIIEGHFEKRKAIPSIVHSELSDIFYEYLRTGGMPSVINEYISDNESRNTDAVKRNLYALMMNDIAEYAGNEAAKCKDVIKVLAKQAVEGKKRFTFGAIRRGVTYAMYSEAIDILVNNGYIVKSDRIGEDGFRLYFFDCGIFGGMILSQFVVSDAGIENILSENKLTVTLAGKYSIGYWESEYEAEIGHVIIEKDSYIPVILNKSIGRKSKSIAVFEEKHRTSKILTVSGENFNSEGIVENIPEYASFLF